MPLVLLVKISLLSVHRTDEQWPPTDVAMMADDDDDDGANPAAFRAEKALDRRSPARPGHEEREDGRGKRDRWRCSAVCGEA